jgi:hypothetical protein
MQQSGLITVNRKQVKLDDMDGLRKISRRTVQ